MNAETPIKRHPLIQPLSREHHHALLLCWKIKSGLSKNVDPIRIKRYADWFYKSHLEPHFLLEEATLFPVLGDDSLVMRAIKEHRRLAVLFADTDNISESLKEIAALLEKHIRFEERTLFNLIQAKATNGQLKAFENIHIEKKFQENEDDKFWE